MANNPYVNKVVYGGQTLIDISDTTATADKILEGYTAYGADGSRLVGTAVAGSVTQDQDGFIVLPPDGGSSPSASDYTLLYSGEVTASTTDTSVTSLTTIETNVELRDYAKKILFVSIRDKAGKRDGYFYGVNQYFLLPSSSFSNATPSAMLTFRINSDSTLAFSTSGYGVYVSRYYGDGDLNISTRYNSSYSLTIDGTYTIKLYVLNQPEELT